MVKREYNFNPTKIGIFDSGLGGLSIFRNIREALPVYDYVYFGDNSRTPYGNRSFEAIYKFTLEGVEKLFSLGCRIVILACNTASAKALRTIQQKNLPFLDPNRRVLGVIRPSVEILATTRNQQVALWATNGTVMSGSYQIELGKLNPGLKLVQQACPILVPLVEAGEFMGAGTEFFIQKYWAETLIKGTQPSTLLLACTHYPLLFPTIRKLIPPEVEILMQGPIVAEKLVDYLFRHQEIEKELSRHQTAKFYTTDRINGFSQLAESFLGHPIEAEILEI